MTTDGLIAALKFSELLKGLSDAELQTVSKCGRVKKYEPNQIVIHEGEIDIALYIILKGSVKVFLPKKTDHSTVVRITRVNLGKLKHGDCLGEYSVIDGNPASASIITVDECILFKLSKTNFEEIITNSDHIAKQIYRNMLNVLIKRSRDAVKELDIYCVL